MTSKTSPLLPEPLRRWLSGGAPAILVTVGGDGWGHTAMTWAVATGPDRVRFGADLGSTTLLNLEREGKASLQVIGPRGLLALIKGRAQKLRDRLDPASFPMTAWELRITEMRDQSWQGVTVLPLTYRWTGPDALSLREKERLVLSALRDAPGDPSG